MSEKLVDLKSIHLNNFLALASQLRLEFYLAFDIFASANRYSNRSHYDFRFRF